MQINNNSQTNFGMAYKMQPLEPASRKIAESISNCIYPEVRKEYFEKLAGNIKALKTKVMTDGDRVIITHPVSATRYEVIDESPVAEPTSSSMVINYHVMKELTQGGDWQSDYIKIRYSKPQADGTYAHDSALFYDGIMRKHINGYEIARKFDDDLVNHNEKIESLNEKNKYIDTISSELAKLSD